MTEKEFMIKSFYDGYLTGKQAKNIYSWFQSKQQEKIEEIKKLTKGKGGIKYGIWADGYLDAIKKVLEILERSK